MKKKRLCILFVVTLVGCNNNLGSSSISNNNTNVSTSSSSTIKNEESNSSSLNNSNLTINFYNGDNTLLHSQVVNYGDSYVFNEIMPSKESNDSNYEYLFKGWDKELNNITNNLEVHPLFDKISFNEENEGDYTYRAIYNEFNEKIAYEVYKYNNFEDEIVISLESSYKGLPITRIGEACYMETPIKGINIPDSVEVIGDYAFNSCPLIEKIDVNKVKVIGDAAFYLLEELKTINLGSTYFIGQDNFHICSKLGSFEVANSNIAYNTYETALYNYDYSTLIKYPENASVVKLNSKTQLLKRESLSRLNNCHKVILDNNILTLEEFVFFESKIKEIEITSSLKEIPNNTFQRCLLLEKITLNEGITSIGDYAFYRCENLEVLNLVNSIESIGDYAFNYCFKIKKMKLPSSLKKLGYACLDEMPALEEISIDVFNKNYTTLDGSLYSKDLSKLIRVPQTCSNYVFPKETYIIGDGAFYKCSSLTSINIPVVIREIGEYAFYFANNIKELYIPSYVRSIANSAFEGMEKLEKVYLPETIEIISKSLFAGCESLVDVKLSSTLKSLEEYAFYGCSSLVTINLARSLTYIGKDCFSLCNSLEEIVYEGSRNEWNKIEKDNSGIDDLVLITCLL